MANEPTTTTICIDIGMTGSAARWKNIDFQKGWRPIFEKKVPTKLAYDAKDEDGPPIAWGEGCTDNLHQQTRECFKVCMDEKYLPNTNPKSTNLVTQAKIQRWMRDYIRLFCEYIIAVIDSNPLANSKWKDATINWIFTVPGSWAQLPTVANFKRLAEEAIYCCIGDNKMSKVITPTTEAQASAQCLLKNGSASSIEGYAPVRYASEGVMNVDTRFVAHFQRIFESAGVSGPLDMAQKTFKDYFSHRLFDFTGKEKDNWIFCHLPSVDGGVRNWPLPKNMTGTGTRLENQKLFIHRDTMIDMFSDFVESIEATIDSVINKLAQKGAQLTVIGLCGGSRMMYPTQRLRQRYEDKVLVLDHRNYSFGPEMATVIGSSMLSDQQTVVDFCNEMHFGIKKGKDDVFWGTLREVQTPSSFDTPYAKEVKFMENTRTVHGSIKHRLIAVPRKNPKFESFSEALQSAGSKVWMVKLDLNRVQRLPASLNREYKIIWKISGRWQIDVRAETDSPTRIIECVNVTEL